MGEGWREGIECPGPQGRERWPGMCGWETTHHKIQTQGGEQARHPHAWVRVVSLHLWCSPCQVYTDSSLWNPEKGRVCPSPKDKLLAPDWARLPCLLLPPSMEQAKSSLPGKVGRKTGWLCSHLIPGVPHIRNRTSLRADLPFLDLFRSFVRQDGLGCYFFRRSSLIWIVMIIKSRLYDSYAILLHLSR